MSQTPAGQDRLLGQVAIVTGGASGIGRATVHALARQSAHVVVVDLNTERIDTVVDETKDLQCDDAETIGLALDVRSEQDMESMARQTLDRFGRIDILVASAGVLRGKGSSPKPLAQISVDEWDYVIDVNLKGMFLSNRAVLGPMIKQRSGNILNLSSVSGKQGRAHDAPYCASKFGVIGMSESLAEEARSYGVRVQVIMPDAVDTPIWDQNGPVPRPPNALAPQRVAELILHMITQPDDTMLLGTVIAPFRTRRRTGAKKTTSVAGKEDKTVTESGSGSLK